MWNFKKINIQNVFSHVDTEYVFNNNTCTLIVGENKDKNGNNGAGKSTIFESIVIALTGKSLRDLKKENFINREAESCCIRLEMENAVKKQSLVITRQFFRGGKSSKVEIIENDEVNTTISSVNEADKRILELIGISREDLLRYFIISQDNNYTFFTAGDVEKKEVLNRITSADMINPLIERLQVDRKAKTSEREECTEELISVRSKKETLEEQMEELLNDSETKSEIERLENKIKKLEEEHRDTLERLAKSDGFINAAKSEIEKLKSVVSDDTELKKERKKITQRISEAEERLDENKKIIRMAKSDLSGSTKCPKCGEVFVQNGNLDLSVEDIKVLIKTAESDNEKVSKDISALEDKKRELNAKIVKNSELEEKLLTTEDKLRRMNIRKKELQEDINSFQSRVDKLAEEIKKVREQKKNDIAIKSIKTKIDECVSRLKTLEKCNGEIEEELEMINYWIYYMGKSGFQTYVANKSVSILEGTVNSYLKKFKSNLSVNINGFKILRDGSVREKIEVFVLDEGFNAEVFMSKSGGERGKINLAGVLAIQHLINMSVDGGLNFIALDESFHGVDSHSQANIIRILESIGITVMMITQNISSEFNNCNTLNVVKENGVSRIM